MKACLKYTAVIFLSSFLSATSVAQKSEPVKIIKDKKEKKINVLINDKLFTSFLYPDTLEKPVLYPLYTTGATDVTRGFPLNTKPGDPTDHPHHIGLWFNYENVNGLDFWNNSYAIPAEKKKSYGWIKTDRILETKSGAKGILSYHARWTDHKNETLL